MNQSLFILGRQPSLGLAELESLYGPNAVQSVGFNAAMVDVNPDDIFFGRLGGSIKHAKVLHRIESTDWNSIERYLLKSIPDHLQYAPPGKFKLGISTYGLNVSVGKLNASGLTIKKALKSTGRSVRIIPNKAKELNTAQVLHNQLTTTLGWELLLVRDGNSTILAITESVQDIESYAARDQARPKRDARVGMLPPKLAQIIINLARPDDGATVLDPFCGTGVVLQEASLMGYNVYGTDLDPRMVEYTEANLQWLNITSVQRSVYQGDATATQWSDPFTTIAAETYLGRPFTGMPTPRVLAEVMQDCDTIHRKFLQNVARQTSSGFRLCIAVPAWKTKNGFKHLKMLDSLGDLGYTRVSFVHADDKALIYHREGQIVGRELVTLQRN